MIYREFGKTGEKLSVLGFGGIRFPKELYMTEPGREELAELAVEAWKNGINYFDTAPSYCNQKGELIYGMAFRHMKDFYVSTKSQISEDPTADDVRRRLETSLRRMGLEKIHFYHMWCILDIDQYRRVIAPGGPYWGALKAKEEGLIDHICFSAHCRGDEIAEIIRDGYFEGVTLGYNVINGRFRQEGVDAAREAGIGVVTMNPLAGGVIPRNQDKFSFVREHEGQSVCEAALRYNAATPGINVVLSGMSNREELYQNIGALEEPLAYHQDYRRSVALKMDGMYDRLCTGCNYCQGCPKEIEVSKLMLSYNQYLLNGQKDSSILYELQNVWKASLEETVPCVACRRCEQKCTQHLNIVERIGEINGVLNRHIEQYKNHLKDIFGTKRRVAFYGMGGRAEKVYADYQRYFNGEAVKAQLFLFDKNPGKHGQEPFTKGVKIGPPKDLEKLGLDLLVISSTVYFDEIYQELKYLEPYGVTIEGV